jgi:hypothetical protein
MSTFIIEDESHCEFCGDFDSFEGAVAELRRRAELPWDSDENRAPCVQWRTCGRAYQVIEYDKEHKPWKQLNRTDVLLSVSADGAVWASGFEHV